MQISNNTILVTVAMFGFTITMLLSALILALYPEGLEISNQVGWMIGLLTLILMVSFHYDIFKWVVKK